MTAPLEQVQIDHTVIDLIVVDDRDRQPIGRPYLTLAIDVFTRCVIGMVVTLEAPSAVSGWPVPRACRLRQAPLAGRTERGNGLADERQSPCCST